MKDIFKGISADKAILRFNVFSVITIVITLLVIILDFRKLPPIIPLFNQLPWGTERLGETPTIFIPPIIVILILTTNIFISNFVYKKTPLVARMLSITSFLVSLLTLLFIFRTIQIVL